MYRFKPKIDKIKGFFYEKREFFKQIGFWTADISINGAILYYIFHLPFGESFIFKIARYGLFAWIIQLQARNLWWAWINYKVKPIQYIGELNEERKK